MKKSKEVALVHSPFAMLPIDIIIPFHNNHDKISNLLESIFRTVRTNRYRVSLVDDASKNKHFILSLSKVRGVAIFQNEIQKGFGSCVNLALSKTKQPFVLIFSPDVIVEGSVWLAHLGEALFEMKNQGVKMVSPLTDNPTIDEQLIGERQFKGENVVLTQGHLPFHCVLCNRELFRRVGVLKEGSQMEVAEDFAGRMKNIGFKQAVCGSSWVKHSENTHVGRI